MKIFIFSNRNNNLNDIFLKEISQIKDLEYCMTFDFDTLFEAVKFNSSNAVIIFMISFEHELDFLISKKKRLFNYRFILILPDKKNALVSKGLLLHPRYLAQTNNGFTDVAAVLNKMVQNIKSGGQEVHDI